MYVSSRRGRGIPPDREDAGGRAGPRFRYKRWVGVVALAGAPLLFAGAVSASTGWSVVTVPQTGNNTILTGASALNSTDAWAVGEQSAAAGQLQLERHQVVAGRHAHPGRDLQPELGQREQPDRRLGGRDERPREA